MGNDTASQTPAVRPARVETTGVVPPASASSNGEPRLKRQVSSKPEPLHAGLHNS